MIWRRLMSVLRRTKARGQVWQRLKREVPWATVDRQAWRRRMLAVRRALAHRIIWRRLALVALAVPVGVTVLAGGLLVSLDPARLVHNAGSQLSAATGLSVDVQGSPSLGVWPSPRVRTGPIRIEADDDLGNFTLSARSAEIALSFPALLRGQLKAAAVTLVAAKIAIPESTVAPSLLQRAMADLDGDLGWLGLRDAEIVIASAAWPEPVILTYADLDLDLPRWGHPAQLSGTVFWRTRPIDLSARIETPDDLLQGRHTSVALALEAEGDNAQFAGTIAMSDHLPYPLISGTLTAHVADLDAVRRLVAADPTGMRLDVAEAELEITIKSTENRLALQTRMVGERHGRLATFELRATGMPGWMQSQEVEIAAVSRSGGLYSAYFDGMAGLDTGLAGQLRLAVLDVPSTAEWLSLPQMPEVQAAQRAAAVAEFSATPSEVELRQANLRLGDRHLSGALSLGFAGTRPSLAVSLTTDELDLGALYELDLASLHQLTGSAGNFSQANFDLSAGQITAGGLTFGQTDMRLRVAPQGTQAVLRRLDLFGGTVIGALRMAPGAETVQAELVAAEIDAAALIDGAGYTGLSGALAAEITGSLVLKSGVPLAQQADFTGEASLYNGSLGLPNLAAISAGRQADGITPFRSLRGQLRVTDGVVDFDEARLVLDGPTLAGHISADLTSGTLTGRWIPVAAAARQSALEIDGTLMSPRVTAVPQRQRSEQQSYGSPMGSNAASIATSTSETDTAPLQTAPTTGARSSVAAQGAEPTPLESLPARQSDAPGIPIPIPIPAPR